jgi:hypothetical protein
MVKQSIIADPFVNLEIGPGTEIEAGRRRPGQETECI